MKKLFALIAVLALVLSVFAGCANAPAPAESEAPAASDAAPSTVPEGEAPDASVPEAPSAEEVAAQEAEHEEAVKAVDKSSIELVLPITAEPQTLSLTCKAINLRPPLDGLGYTTWADFSFENKLEEMTNVHIEWQEISFMVYTEQFNLLMAGGEYGDIIDDCVKNYSGGGAKAVEDGVIIPLNDYMDKAPFYSYYMENVGTFKQDFALDDGSIVDFKSFYDEYHSNNGMVIRQDWLDALGLDVPKTYDQLGAVLEAIKTEYGCDTTFFLPNSLTVDGFVGGFGVSTGATMFQVDGQIKCSILEPAFLDYINLLKDWYDKGLVNPDFGSVEYDPFSPVISEGVGTDNIAVWPVLYEEADKFAGYNQNPDFKLTAIPNPVVNEGEIDHISTRKMIDNDTLSVSASCENPELAVAWMDFWFSDEGFNMYNYGVGGETYELVDGKPEFTDFAINNEFGITVASFMRGYCPYGSLMGIYSPGRSTKYLSDLQAQCWEVWTASSDGAYSIPTGISYTALESEERSGLETDIETCVDENLIQFITGVKSMDEWDGFLSQLDTLKLDRVMEIYQDALDRYYAR